MTKPQLDELRRLARGKQSTYGRARARVQNSLVRERLACYRNEDGSARTFQMSAYRTDVYDYCEITDAGRAALAEALPTKSRRLPPKSGRF